jgi:hypothetical protein
VANTPCYCPGTLIRTNRGQRRVEKLKIGDKVMTVSGTVAPISWIGRRIVSTAFADPLRILPIRIKAGALADSIPSRDLLLSPDHAILVDDVIIQAGALVNVPQSSGKPMFRRPSPTTTSNSMIILILAENTPTETFIDNVDRLAFDNWEEHEALYPQGKPIVEMPYPRAKAHRQVPRPIRERLAERGMRLFGTSVRSAA